MNKAELIAAMAAKTGETKKAAENSVNAFVEVVTETLKKGDKVQLVGFGSFEVRESPIQVLKEEEREATAKSYVIGRKGWLFSDSPEGAEASAISYSIAETALANGLNIYKYMISY